MTVQNGQLADESTFNDAFMSRIIKALGVGIEIDSTTEFSRPYPKMTTAQRDTITATEADTLYNLDSKRLEIYDGTDWGVYDNVDSVNGKTGVVVLNPDDLDDTSTTHKFTTQAEKDANAAHIADLANPHAVTTTQLGLENVDNTSDVNKPISDDTQTALDLKANALDLSTHEASYFEHKEVDTKANLINWATTAPEGAIGYAFDKKIYYSVKNSLLVKIGGGLDKWVTLTDYKVDDVIWLEADNKIYRCITLNNDAAFTPVKWQELSESVGGGAEVPSTYKLFNAEDGDITDFVNITINATNPINGLADYEVTAYPASFPVVSTFPRNLGKRNTLTIQYTIVSGEAKVSLSGGGMASAVEAVVDNTSKKVVLEYYPQDATDLTLTITDESSATGLKLDDLVFSDEQREIKNFTVSQTMEASGLSRSGNFMAFPTIDEGNGKLATINNVTGRTRVTFLRDVDSFVAVFGRQAGGAGVSTAIINLYNSLGIIIKEGGEASDSSSRDSSALGGKASKGDYIEVYNDSGNPLEAYFSVTATATSSGTVYASEMNKEDIVILQKGNSSEVVGAGTPITFGTAVEHWSGTTFTVPETGIYNIKGSVGQAVANSTMYYLYINGALRERVSEMAISSDFKGFSGTFKWNKNDEVYIIPDQNITLVGSYTNDHYISITKQAVNVDNLILQNPDGSFETQTYFVPNDISAGQGAITTFNTNVGDRYRVKVTGYHRVFNSQANGISQIIASHDGTVIASSNFGIYTAGLGYEARKKGADYYEFTATTTTVEITYDIDTSHGLEGNGTSSGTNAQLTKLPKEMGVDVLGEVITNHVTGGIEYELKGQLLDGKQVYARSWDTIQSVPSGSQITIATTITGMDVLDLYGMVLSGANWYKMNSNIGGNNNYVTYYPAGGTIDLRHDGISSTRQRFTITYTKP